MADVALTALDSSACSAHRVLVPSMSTTEKQKVCRDCYEEFGGPTDENDDVGDLPVVAPLMSLVSTFGKSMKRMVQRTSSTGSTNSTSSGGMESPALGKGRNAMMTTFSARRDVAAELLRTESQFHADLEVTLAVMVHPLLSPSLDKDIARTFEALEVIKSLSLKLTRDLDAAVNQDWDDGTTRIGEIFARHASLLNLFADYASNVNAAVKALARSDMRSRVQGVEADPRAAGTRLARRLLVPLQRLSSYTFLLTKLMKMTPPEHCDYGAIADAIAKITSSSKLVTSAMKESGNHAKLQAMEATFKGKVSLDADGREFIRSGKVFLFDPNAVFAKGEAVPRLDAVTVHLFNDRLIVSRGDDKKGYKVDHDLLVDEFADIGFDAEAEAFLAEQGAGSEPPGHYCVMRMRISDTVLGVISKEPNRSWFKDILNVVNATYLKRNAQTDATLEAGSSSA